MTKTEAMFKLVEAQQRSGKTRREFAESKGMKYVTFQYWSKRYREQQDSTEVGTFIPLTENALSVPERDASMLVVILESGTRVEIH